MPASKTQSSHSAPAKRLEPVRTEQPVKSLRVRILESEVAGWPKHMRQFYELMVACGTAPVLAHMLASRQAPVMGQSDRSFCESLHRSMSGMSPELRAGIVENARRAGINTDGKFHVSGLGSSSDPAAWCSTIEDARRTLAARPHLNANGLVTQRATMKPEGPPQRKLLADDLAGEMIRKEIATDGRLREKVAKGKVKGGELREMVEDKYAYKDTKPAQDRVVRELVRRAKRRMAAKRAATTL